MYDWWGQCVATTPAWCTNTNICKSCPDIMKRGYCLTNDYALMTRAITMNYLISLLVSQIYILTFTKRCTTWSDDAVSKQLIWSYGCFSADSIWSGIYVKLWRYRFYKSCSFGMISSYCPAWLLDWSSRAKKNIFANTFFSKCYERKTEIT